MGSEVDFEKLAQGLASARMMLAERVHFLEAQVANLKKKELPAIRAWAEKAAGKQQELHDAIEENPEAFVSPKTMIMHGIRFGWQKGKGAISWEDEAKVLKLIKKNFPDQAEILIKTKEKPVKKALAQLSAQELKTLGVLVEETGEIVFIKFTDSEIDKIVNAILGKEAEEEEG